MPKRSNDDDITVDEKEPISPPLPSNGPELTFHPSVAKWSNFAAQFGLPQNVQQVKLETFKTAKYLLPPSLHEATFENALHWEDAYREKVDQMREGCIRSLDPYIVPILALFQGRVVDKLEQPMMETRYLSRGEVEYQIFMTGAFIFVVIEFKVGVSDANTVSQLFLELLSAAEVNKSTDFEGLRVYGLLTDLNQFKFCSYDPSANQFCFDETMIIDNTSSIAFFQMMDVSNKIFGVVLSAYMDGLRARITKSKNKTKHNNPLELVKEGMLISGCKSTDQWEDALSLAQRCLDKFKEPVASHELEDIEYRANEALAFLTKSVRCISRASLEQVKCMKDSSSLVSRRWTRNEQ